MIRLRTNHAFLLLLGSLAACAVGAEACGTGVVGGTGQAGGVGSTSNGNGNGGPASNGSSTNGASGTTQAPGSSSSQLASLSAQGVKNCSQPDPGRSPLRRLSLTEYATTIQDLLGSAVNTSSVLTSFPPDQLLATQGAGFSNNADALEVSALLANAYQTASETFATAAVGNLSSLETSCSLSTGGDACAQTFIASFGRRAFRRPLTTAEQTTYLGLYHTGMTAPEGSTVSDGISLVIEAFLQSPNFLYRVEHGNTSAPNATATVAPVTDLEMATRLSYFFWGSEPSDALLDVAVAGQLHTADQVSAEVTKMLTDPRAKTAMSNFNSEWLTISAIGGISPDPNFVPGVGPNIPAELQQETQTFVDNVFWNDGKTDTLFGANYTYVNPDLAKFYGLTVPSGTGATSFVQVMLDPTQRAGVLTLGGIQAANAKQNQTSPVLRGKFVREQILCQEVPSPPAGIVITPPTVTPGTTTRQRFAQHESQALCASCHVQMDGLGLGFEHYDPAGRWRDLDQGLPIDDSGQITGGTDVDGAFNGGVELAKKFSQSESVRQCVVKQFFRYANGRVELPPSTPTTPSGGVTDDGCTLQTLYKDLDSGHDMRDLRAQIATSDAFLYRSVQGGGGQ
jgi:hypothetical protein